MPAHLQFGVPAILALLAIGIGLANYLGYRFWPPVRSIWFFSLGGAGLLYLAVSYLSFDTVERVEFIYDQEPQYMGYDCEPANFQAYWLRLTRPALYEGMSYSFFVTVKDSVSRFAEQDCRVMAGLAGEAAGETNTDPDGGRVEACLDRLDDRVAQADRCLSRIGYALQ